MSITCETNSFVPYDSSATVSSALPNDPEDGKFRDKIVFTHKFVADLVPSGQFSIVFKKVATGKLENYIISRFANNTAYFRVQLGQEYCRLYKNWYDFSSPRSSELSDNYYGGLLHHEIDSQLKPSLAELESTAVFHGYQIAAKAYDGSGKGLATNFSMVFDNTPFLLVPE